MRGKQSPPPTPWEGQMEKFTKLRIQKNSRHQTWWKHGGWVFQHKSSHLFHTKGWCWTWKHTHMLHIWNIWGSLAPHLVRKYIIPGSLAPPISWESNGTPPMPPTAENQAFFFRGWHGGGTLRFSWQYQNPRCTLDNDFSQSWTEHWASRHHKQSSQEPFLDIQEVSATASSHSSGKLTQNNHSHRILIWHIYVYHRNQANVGKYTIHYPMGFEDVSPIKEWWFSIDMLVFGGSKCLMEMASQKCERSNLSVDSEN